MPFLHYQAKSIGISQSNSKLKMRPRSGYSEALGENIPKYKRRECSSALKDHMHLWEWRKAPLRSGFDPSLHYAISISITIKIFARLLDIVFFHQRTLRLVHEGVRISRTSCVSQINIRRILGQNSNHTIQRTQRERRECSFGLKHYIDLREWQKAPFRSGLDIPCHNFHYNYDQNIYTTIR